MHKVASTRIYFTLCALFSLAAFGCDSSSGEDDDPMPPATGGTGGGGNSTGEMLANCETPSAGDPTVHDGYFKHPGTGWELAWFTYSDNAEAMTAGKALGTITPTEGQPFKCIQDADPARSWVFNAKGGPFSVWGAGMGFNMQIMAAPTPPVAVDLTTYKGIRFYAKVGATTTGPVRVKVVDAQTTPTARGGTCTGTMGACDNNFGYVLTTISADWQQFSVTWDQMKQETWASQKFTAAEVSKVLGFQFQVGKTSFDYSVDDFELIK